MVFSSERGSVIDARESVTTVYSTMVEGKEYWSSTERGARMITSLAVGRASETKIKYVLNRVW